MNKISIVTICFNESINIMKTLKSIATQTYRNVEYIIKDGVSTDDTNKIIENFLLEYPQMCSKHIVKKDKGIYDAMNQALDECNSDWIIFINAGDTFVSSNVLENIFGKELKYEADILYGDVITQDISGQNIWSANLGKLPYNMPFSHQACFIKTSLLQEMRFDMRFKIVADYEMILRCYERGCIFQCTNTIIAVFNLDGVSSTNYIAKVLENYSVWKTHYLLKPKTIIRFPFLISFAWLKYIIDQYMPKVLTIKLRRIYKTYIKGYKTANGEYKL